MMIPPEATLSALPVHAVCMISALPVTGRLRVGRVPRQAVDDEDTVRHRGTRDAPSPFVSSVFFVAFRRNVGNGKPCGGGVIALHSWWGLNPFFKDGCRDTDHSFIQAATES